MVSSGWQQGSRGVSIGRRRQPGRQAAGRTSELRVCSNWRRGWESGHSFFSMHLHSVKHVSARLLHFRLHQAYACAMQGHDSRPEWRHP